MSSENDNQTTSSGESLANDPGTNMWPRPLVQGLFYTLATFYEGDKGVYISMEWT